MIALEQLRDGSAADRNFLKLTGIVIDTGGTGVGVRFGSTVVATSASATGSATQAHGLGKAPVAAFATGVGTGGLINAEIQSFDATNVVLRVGYTDGTGRTQNNTVYWLVIG